MPGQYGQSYRDNNGSIWNWNESLQKYTRMKTQQRDRSATPVINTSANAQAFKNRRAIKVNPDGKVRNTVTGGSDESSTKSTTPDKGVVVDVIKMAKRNFSTKDIASKLSLTPEAVNKIIGLAIEAGHKLGKKTQQEVLDSQLYELLSFGDESEYIQKALNECKEPLQKSEPDPVGVLPTNLPVTQRRLTALLKSRTSYKMSLEGHHHH